MSHLQPAKVFYDTGEDLLESKNFQGFLFRDIDFRKREKPLSFFRSDFRGSKFDLFTLYQNNFDRADFIDSYFNNGTIENCYFGSDFNNTYFNGIKFVGNQFESCSFYNCIFNGCSFTGGIFKEVNLRECKFLNCRLEHPVFQANTVDEIEFSQCQFEEVDFSNMTMMNIYFSYCTYSGVSIDPDYLGSYFIKGDFLEGTKFKYRGHEIKLFEKQQEVVNGLIHLFGDTNRYYEQFNLLILKAAINGSLEASQLLNIVGASLEEPSQLIRDAQLKKIFQCIQFYATGSKVPLRVYFLIIGAIEEAIENKTDIGVSLWFSNQLAYTKAVVEKELIDVGDTEFNTTKVFVEVQLNLDSVSEGERILRTFLDLVGYGRSQDSSTLYEIISIRKGSVIVEILCYGFTALALSAIVKSTTRNLMETVFIYKFLSKGTKLLKKAESKKDLLNVKELVSDGKGYLKLAGTDEGNALKSLMKSMKVFVNAH